MTNKSTRRFLRLAIALRAFTAEAVEMLAIVALLATLATIPLLVALLLFCHLGWGG